MATFTWNTGSGAFNAAGVWTPSGPPGAADTAVFMSGSGTISGTGNVATLQLNPSGPWTWTGTLTAKNYNVNDTVTLSTGAVWTLAGTPASSNYLVIGSGSGGSGGVSVTNGASIVSTQAANTTAYALYVASGTASDATGALTVSGAGSSVNTGQNGAAVGEAGTGTLTVQSGGSASFASTNSSLIAALAVGRAGSGTVNVTGGSSSLTANGFVYIGRGGTGALTVSGGATFTGGATSSSAGGAASIDIGDSSAATSSQVYFGGSGVVQITTGATLHSLNALNVGLSGTSGSLTVDGAGSLVKADAAIQVGGGTERVGGKGTLTIQNGGTARAGTPAAASAGIAIGSGMTGDVGTAVVTGAGSLLDANGYRLSVGTANTTAGSTTGGAGTLTISNGAHALAGASYSDTEAALAVGAFAGGTGSISITGTGSQLIASGIAVIGGTNTGSGVVAGGTGTVSVTGGGLLQTGAMTIQAGSSLTVDQSSTLAAPSININGGTADLGNLTTATAISFGSGGTLRLHTVTGTNTIANFALGDEVDFAGASSVTVVGNAVVTGAGQVVLGAAPANASYQVISDGRGGTFVALEPTTIGVYRFFDNSTGTHFYTSDPNEDKTILQTRPDLVPEGPGGIGLQAVAVASSDPHAAPVYRFFDTVFGTHFFTASATERDTIINTRPDLTYEASSTFYEHTTQQPGDIAVDRYFDNVHGTHFYSDSPAEQATIAASRPDLVLEGVGFYEPPQNYAVSKS